LFPHRWFGSELTSLSRLYSLRNESKQIRKKAIFRLQGTHVVKTGLKTSSRTAIETASATADAVIWKAVRTQLKDRLKEIKMSKEEETEEVCVTRYK
jgi:DNA-binding TFAR19-related protein (PDSD5 family)